MNEQNNHNDEFEKVSHGNPINPIKHLPDGIIILTKNGQLSAVAKNSSDIIKSEKVFI